MSKSVLEQKSELPTGWIYSTLGNLSFFITKGTTPTTHGFAYQKKGINFIKTENIVNGWIEYTLISEFISEEAYDFLKRSQLKEKDILFSIAGTIGRTTIIRKKDLPANTNQALAIIRCPSKFIEPKFIRLILDSPSIFNLFNEKKRGMGLDNISLGDLKSLLIPLPPLNEQKRIVAKIESIFSRIDAAKVQLETLASQAKSSSGSLNILKSSVLKQAFEGRLVPQDPNDEHAEMLLQKIHKDSKNELEFEKKDLPEGWVRTTLENILNPSKERFDPTTSKNKIFIGLEHIEANTGKIIRKGNSKEFTSTKTVFRSDDILYGKLRPYLNKVCVPNFDGVCSTDILVFSNNSLLSNKFISFFLRTSDFVAYSNANMTGVQHPRISFKKLGLFSISLPPLPEQKRIVAKIESIFGRIDAADRYVKDTLYSLEILKQSVLKQAFEGKLVPQDPSDESAEILLQKIQQEKQLIQNTKPKRGKKNVK